MDRKYILSSSESIQLNCIFTIDRENFNRVDVEKFERLFDYFYDFAYFVARFLAIHKVAPSTNFGVFIVIYLGFSLFFQFVESSRSLHQVVYIRISFLRVGAVHFLHCQCRVR